MTKFHLLTFETKYSRRKSNKKGEEAVILVDKERCLLANCIVESVKKLGIKLLAGTVLLDHVHLVIADMGKDIQNIAKQIKGASAHEVNRRFKSSVQGNGYQQNLWAKGYNDSFLDDEDHLFNAIEYVNNNYLKHEERWGEIEVSKIQKVFEPVLYDTDNFRWNDFEYKDILE